MRYLINVYLIQENKIESIELENFTIFDLMLIKQIMRDVILKNEFVLEKSLIDAEITDNYYSLPIKLKTGEQAILDFVVNELEDALKVKMKKALQTI